ncbi:MAG: response regulator transcription factor [Geobacter sp.]|nr:response regulator transcription factor [Geobacter sp.]
MDNVSSSDTRADNIVPAPGGAPMKKILIVDDHTMFRQALIAVLDSAADQGPFVYAEAANADSALSKLASDTYDLVILDINLPETNGLELLPELKLRQPKLPVLVLSMHADEEYALRSLKLGASCYLSKKAAADELLMAVSAVLEGRRYVSSTLSSTLLEQLLSLEEGKTKISLLPSLSQRETEVLRRMATGQRLKDISLELGLSIKTVSTYKTRLFEKLGFKNTIELYRYAARHQLC